MSWFPWQRRSVTKWFPVETVAMIARLSSVVVMPMLVTVVVIMMMVLTGNCSNLDGDFWNVQPQYNRVHSSASNSSYSNRESGARSRGGSWISNKQADMLLAVPDGAVIGILPKFGWLLYEGESNEEIDFRLESEFLYRFPRSRSSEVGLERSMTSGRGQQTSEHHRRRHRRELRQTRMARDKKMIYKGLARMFRNFGMDGDVCVQKTICQISSTPLLHDGVIGELLNIALIPSHRYGEGTGLDEYRQAEKFGREGGDCEVAYMHCPMSMFVRKQL